MMRGITRTTFTLEEAGGPWVCVGVFVMAMLQQQVLEYYWHRFLHLPTPYAYIHKVHHFYKSPEPFDDMYAHPFEILGEPLLRATALGLVNQRVLVGSVLLYLVFAAVPAPYSRQRVLRLYGRAWFGWCA